MQSRKLPELTTYGIPVTSGAIEIPDEPAAGGAVRTARADATSH